MLCPLDGAPKIAAGKTPLLAVASDYQESKNIDQAGNILPNTSFRSLQLHAVKRPTVNWLLPRPLACGDAGREPARDRRRDAAVSGRCAFLDGKRLIATKRSGSEGLFGAAWHTAKTHAGRHVLRAVVTDRRGATVSATRVVRVCRR